MCYPPNLCFSVLLLLRVILVCARDRCYDMTARRLKTHFSDAFCKRIFLAVVPQSSQTKFTWQSARCTYQKQSTDHNFCASTHTVHCEFSTAKEDSLPDSFDSLESDLSESAKHDQ